jgi:hypothetical protein
MVAQCTEDMVNAWNPNSPVDLRKELRILAARIASRFVLDAEMEGHGPIEGRSGVLPFSEAYGEDYLSGDPTDPLIMVRPRAPTRRGSYCR